MKLPWERDPNDLEANYRRPVPRSERVRLGIKVGAAVAAAVSFRFWILDQEQEGAKLVLALGAALLVAGVTDLVYLRSREIELIFLRSREQQRRVQALVAAGGAALLVSGLLAYAS